MKQSLILHGKALNVMVIPSVLNYSGMLIGNQKKKKNAGCPFSRLLSTLFIILFPSLQFFSQLLSGILCSKKAGYILV